ncbi:type IIA DNA topoisomerase subunit B [Patescibacteria group bacterium]|nr:type IIA DNA topoisomerase subunit B [Patescibacteria group bacterium]MBU1247045.1 type IIA DNA topoisomerase subunit B [Patescibacteria group bacterium]MBU1519634.1 type IIA DNA topoisomerase subunit B [Patescibacteria group bacterium]MBU1730458.1 type IIA DNA topoisomerase subunit B [Patescibacteria group bacterium]MBU1956562.1 type IIA DNA topoisomerase subunit B [Patescibacteria group bacterium]
MAKKTEIEIKKNKQEKYGADEITVLEGLEPVRKRPGMYIGSTGVEGLQHLIWEIFDNSRDEAMGGFADHIEIALLPNNKVRIVDNGRGIPVDIHKKTKVSALETIMTTLHAGGKFEGKGYKVSGGLHGVGASVVNALSVRTKVEVHRDKKIFMQEYVRGKKRALVKQVGKTTFNGTIITFEPDPEIFKEIEYNWKSITNHMRQQAYLVKKLRIHIIDAREYINDIAYEKEVYIENLSLCAPNTTFYFEGGLRSLVEFYNSDFKQVHKNIFYIEKESNEVLVELALQYIDDISSRELAFANNTFNAEGGMHVTGFRTALTRRLNDYARKNNIIKEKDENFTADDVREGITVVISVKMREIQFEGQTKGKLGSVEARGAVEKIFGEAFAEFLEEHPDEARAILNKVSLALRARKAAKAAKDSVLRKGALEGLTLPGKLADCSSRSAEESELFIVEGDSAGGSSKQGRDRRTQAILPLKGKILNVERARLDRMLGSKEIRALVIALGTAIGDTFNIEKLRYHKVIIATDADVDGAHIATLLLTLFYRYFKPLIDGGYIYLAMPPLYKIKKGKESTYVYTEEEKIKYLGADAGDMIEEEPEDKDGEEGEQETKEEVGTKKTPKISLQRYKGLGEMNPEELWETTMDPKNRLLKQITIEDAQEADHTFDVLMGTDVPSRKAFIQTNAKLAKLDL